MEPSPLCSPDHSPTGRNPKENSQALEEFKKFTWSKGLLQENIFILKQKGEGLLCTSLP
jgi:hypothetical protein